MNEAKFEAFKAAYLKGLAEAIEASPEEYAGQVVANVPGTVDKMMRAIREKPLGVNYNSGGLRRTCKVLGIKHTRKAIFEYLEVK